MKILFYFVCFKVVLGSTASGIYYDNGVDQTVVHKALNVQEKKEVQSEILQLLGLQHRPYPFSYNKVAGNRQNNVNLNSAPRFLMDVYESLVEEESGELKLPSKVLGREFIVSEMDLDFIDEADLIMSFTNHGMYKLFIIC